MIEAANASPLTAAIGQAMLDATLAGCDLREAGEAMEAARSAIAAAPSLPLAAERVTALAARQPDASLLAGVLIKLRDRWIEAALADLASRLGGMSDPAERHAVWHAAIAEAVAEFRFDLAARIADLAVLLPTDLDPSAADIAEWARLGHEGRWREAQALLQHLGRDATRPQLARARALSILAELEALVMQDTNAAEEAVAQAEAIAPNDWRCAFVRARLASETGDFDRAEVAFERAASAAPDIADVPAEWALMRAKKGDLEGARTLLVRAGRCAIRAILAISTEFKLSGVQPRFFEAMLPRQPSLLARARLLANQPEDAAEIYINAAEAFDANQQTSEAFRLYDEAERLAPKMYSLWLGRGYLHLNQQDTAAARRQFDRVVELAPGAVDGHWGLCSVAEEIHDWALLLKAAHATLQRAPDWFDAVAARLRAAAEAAAQVGTEPAEARRFAAGVREVLGIEYEARYRNILGHIAYHESDFASAADEYLRAIAASDRPQARFFANLSLALEGLHDARLEKDGALREAIVAAERAAEIAPDESEYRERLTRLRSTQAFVARHGAAAQDLAPDAIRLRIQIDSGLADRLVDRADGQNLLNAVFTTRMQRLRETIRDTALFTLCAVRLEELNADLPMHNWWALEAGGAVLDSGVAPTDASPELLMDIFVDAIHRRLSVFLGHAEANSICDNLPGVSLPDRTHAGLTALARTARTILTTTNRIDLQQDRAALLQALQAKPPERATGHATPDVERVILVVSDLGPDRVLLDGLQAEVFEATGVIIPEIMWQVEAEFGEGEWRIVTDPPSLVPEPPGGLSAGQAIFVALSLMADRLLGSVALHWQLAQVRGVEPDLVAAALAADDEAALLEKLRCLVREGHSIRNLRQALEHLLLDSPAPARIPEYLPKDAKR